MKVELNCRRIVRRLRSEGWEEVLPRTRGSHRKFAKEGMGTLTVPETKRDMKLKTARSIARDAGWLSGGEGAGGAGEPEGRGRVEQGNGRSTSGKDAS